MSWICEEVVLGGEEGLGGDHRGECYREGELGVGLHRNCVRVKRRFDRRGRLEVKLMDLDDLNNNEMVEQGWTWCGGEKAEAGVGNAPQATAGAQPYNLRLQLGVAQQYNVFLGSRPNVCCCPHDSKPGTSSSTLLSLSVPSHPPSS